MPSYTCPDCNAKLKTAAEAQPGQEFTCPQCDAKFTPRAATIAFKDDPPAKPKAKATAKAKAKPAAAAPAGTPAPEQPQPRKMADDDDDGPKTYGLAEESEEEKRLAEKNKPTFGAVRDKYAKTARGPAAALLVTPVNLLLLQGGLLTLYGLLGAFFWQGLWGIIFTGGTPLSDEEFAEYLGWLFVGIICTLWGAITCYGAVQAITLGSYPWAVVAGFFGLLPLFAGIFMLLTIWDPRVIAGFAEPETGPIKVDAEEEEEDDEEDEEDEEDEDEEEEEEEEEKPKKKRR